MWPKTPTILLATALSAGTLFAQAENRAKEKPTGFVLEAGEHSLRSIIERASKYLGRNYLMPTELDMPNLNVVLQKTLALDANGCEQVVSQLVYSKNFAITPLDPGRGLYEVIFMRGAKRPQVIQQALTMTVEEVLRRPRLKMYVCTTIKLKHVDASHASQQLRPFFAAGGARGGGLSFGTGGSSRQLLLQGFADNVASAIRTIQSLDVPEIEGGKSAAYGLRGQVSNLSRLVKAQAGTIEALKKRLARVEGKLGDKQLVGQDGKGTRTPVEQTQNSAPVR